MSYQFLSPKEMERGWQKMKEFLGRTPLLSMTPQIVNKMKKLRESQSKTSLIFLVTMISKKPIQKILSIDKV